ncbi:MAG: protein kinase, partial [Terrimicrobiaceae bacterium]|nr:protein kinase [Terrimicrobiaceae bacterium]
MQTSRDAPSRAAGWRRAPMLARISPQDSIIYANRALADYLGVSKAELAGASVESVAALCRGEIAGCFRRADGGRKINRLVCDAEGRVFEAKTCSEGGVLDIILDEVSPGGADGCPLEGATGTPVEELAEDELRTARQPERRYLTISFTRLRDVPSLAAKLPPMDLRVMLDSFLEEAGEAVLETGCTLGAPGGQSLEGIFGAPRLFSDHPLRAVRAACETLRRVAVLHGSFTAQGKEMPPCSIGIWTGEALVGVFGAGPARGYSALGAPAELASRLSLLSRPGEILLPEHTLTHILRVLPEGWTHLRAESETEPDLSDFHWSGDEVVPVAEHLRKVVYLVGPGVEEDPSRAELYFDYLWAFKVRGRAEPVPILRVARPAHAADTLELRADNVLVTSPSEVLGKYRLVEVLGSGGMGKVWRAVDRFGNNVAIKVLHSGDGVGEAQIARFRREAEVMARLSHRNICRVYEMNEFEGIHYLAMEYVEGLSLADVLYSGAVGSTEHGVDLPTLIRSIREARASATMETADVGSGGREAAEEEEIPREQTAGARRPQETRVLPVQQALAIMLKVCEAVQFA